MTAPEQLWGDLPLGSRVHKSLEQWYGHGNDPRAAHDRFSRNDVALLEDDSRTQGWQLDQLYKDIIVGRNCVESFWDWLAAENPDEPYETVAAEVKVEIPLLEGRILLRGIIDLLKRRKADGALIIEDFKTSSVWRAGQRERLERSPQPHVYGHAAQGLFPDERVAGAQYLILMKVANRKWVKNALIERIDVPAFMRVTGVKLGQLEEICREILRIMERTTELGSVAAFPTVQDACRWCSFRHPCEIMDENPASAIAMLDAEFNQGMKHARYRDHDLLITP
jgi:RecB family exonuclease